MKKKRQGAEEYVHIITEDDLNRIVWEETISYTDFYIERQYEIDDGALVKYEWRSFPGNNAEESYNHRFTLLTPPKKNPEKLEMGIIKIILHPTNSR